MHEVEPAESQAQRPTNTQPLAFTIVVVAAASHANGAGGHGIWRAREAREARQGWQMSDAEQPSLPAPAHLASPRSSPGEKKGQKDRPVLARGRARPQGQKVRDRETEKEKERSIGWPQASKDVETLERRLCDSGHDDGP